MVVELKREQDRIPKKKNSLLYTPTVRNNQEDVIGGMERLQSMIKSVAQAFTGSGSSHRQQSEPQGAPSRAPSVYDHYTGPHCANGGRRRSSFNPATGTLRMSHAQVHPSPNKSSPSGMKITEKDTIKPAPSAPGSQSKQRRRSIMFGAEELGSEGTGGMLFKMAASRASSDASTLMHSSAPELGLPEHTVLIENTLEIKDKGFLWTTWKKYHVRLTMDKFLSFSADSHSRPMRQINLSLYTVEKIKNDPRLIMLSPINRSEASLEMRATNSDVKALWCQALRSVANVHNVAKMLQLKRDSSTENTDSQEDAPSSPEDKKAKFRALAHATKAKLQKQGSLSSFTAGRSKSMLHFLKARGGSQSGPGALGPSPTGTRRASLGELISESLKSELQEPLKCELQERRDVGFTNAASSHSSAPSKEPSEVTMVQSFSQDLPPSAPQPLNQDHSEITEA